MDWIGKVREGAQQIPKVHAAGFASSPCRPLPHQQSKWSQPGQQEGAVIPGGLHSPSLDTKSGRGLEPCYNEEDECTGIRQVRQVNVFQTCTQYSSHSRLTTMYTSAWFEREMDERSYSSIPPHSPSQDMQQHKKQ